MNETELIEFTPPEGTVEEGAAEGEAMVKWQRKPDGRYCIVEFEGKPLAGYSEESEQRPSPESELESLATENR